MSCFAPHPDPLVQAPSFASCAVGGNFSGGRFKVHLPSQTILLGLVTNPQIESVLKCIAQVFFTYACNTVVACIRAPEIVCRT